MRKGRRELQLARINTRRGVPTTLRTTNPESRFTSHEPRSPNIGPIMSLRVRFRMRSIVPQIPAHVFVRSREVNVRFRGHALAG